MLQPKEESEGMCMTIHKKYVPDVRRSVFITTFVPVILLLSGCSEGTTDIVGINLTLFIQALSLVIVILVMKKLVYKKVLDALDKRKADIAHDIASAEEMRREAQKIKDDYELMLKDAYIKAEQIRKEITDAAHMEKEKIVESGRLELEHLRAKNEHEFQLEVAKAKSELVKQVADISIAIASKVLKEEVSEKKHDAMIQQLIQEVGVEREK